jgi:cytochrome c oxidase assembly protein subunit 15
MNRAARRRVASWLLVSAAMVFAMVVVGGVTRLTHSGLSIVEWQPLIGAIPPLSDADWQTLFDKYKATPEYRHVNLGMTLDAFRHIFWWEYFHRLLGRAIGLVFFFPLVAFVVRREIPRALAGRLASVFALGAAQGGMGWYMVKSGLVDDPRVSPYRLSAHLGLAFAIFGAVVWMALDLLADDEPAPRATASLHRAAMALSAAVFVMVLSGGFVAGTRAGFAFNTFPLMAGHWVPEGLFPIDPWWRNFFENIPLVQFDHRLIATLLSIAIPWLCLRVRTTPALGARAHRAAVALLAALVLQIALGLATLLLVVPVTLAAAHQAGAVVLFSACLWLTHALRPAAPATEPAPARAAEPA